MKHILKEKSEFTDTEWDYLENKYRNPLKNIAPTT